MGDIDNIYRHKPAAGGLSSHLVVFLHGYGADGKDLIDLANNSFDNFKIVSLMKKIVPEYISNHSEFQILDNNDKNSI